MGLFSKKGAGPPPPTPPPPPPPALPPSASRPRPGKERATQQVEPPPSSVGIGVETEFLLSARHASGPQNLRDFSIRVANEYNHFLTKVEGRHPNMHNAIDQAYFGEKFAEWSLDADSTIDVQDKNRAPFPLEAISPILRAFPGSKWRSHIEALWRFLEQNYNVKTNDSCGTHVHISLAGGYTLEALQNIAQAIIHFEPAFEVILPLNRHANMYSRSNWIDNPEFGYSKLSRTESMAKIRKTSSIRNLVLLMNPNHDKMYGWNFLYLLSTPKGTIEFRRGPASKNAADVFTWIELAMAFVKASAAKGSWENLRMIPRNLSGLSWFLHNSGLSQNNLDVHNFDYLAALFHRKDMDASPSPKPLGDLSSAKREKLKRKKAEDEKKNIIESKILKPPYWS